MASLYSTQSYVTADDAASAEEQSLPEALHCTSLLMRSLQSEQAFETVRNRLCSILACTITTVSVLLAISGVFISTGSPVSYFNYMSPVPYCLLFILLMLTMIAMLTSGLSMMHWLHADCCWIQEQLEQGGCFVLSYLLSIVTPIFFVTLSLHCFMFAMLIAGFASQSMICCAITVLWLVTYAVNVGTILMEAMWKYATSLNHTG
ncbi:uncharacterized protein F5147DRAFT_776752 [Suillus discolor]|uniref:Uncharacterized protein n=1 Tax=Suillus discolor TaxID=1912936 RepID=A0A9P7F277_9AGAM|nr:uncharacterized protein F5147DRAFT_776752 [Suillus discolor]KAG2101027.1 hypothetical protein F5147DRAFT_776752 [Suillus discolor]